MKAVKPKTKPSVCLYFHVHQPVRLNRFSVFSTAKGLDYFDTGLNHHYFAKATRQCYLPTNRILLELLEDLPDFRLSFSMTGTFVEQCMAFPEGKEVLESFKKLFSTGRVELVGETYYHSLASLSDPAEFREQVREHEKMLARIFGAAPRVFRNTEMIYNNEIGEQVEALGYSGILTEGIERVLGWRSPNYIYSRRGGGLKILLRNYRLSDDIGYRFSARWWSEWPLTADKYASWLSACEGQTVNIFMDYETFGEHQWAGTGIFDFLRHFPKKAIELGLEFRTVSETIDSCEPVGELDVPETISWADLERDESAWLGNRLQRACFSRLVDLGEKVKNLGNEEILRAWRLLQTSDNFYYMCTKSWADGDVHKHFSPHKEFTPFDSFISFMNIIQDFRKEVESRCAEKNASFKLDSDVFA